MVVVGAVGFRRHGSIVAHATEIIFAFQSSFAMPRGNPVRSTGIIEHPVDEGLGHSSTEFLAEESNLLRFVRQSGLLQGRGYILPFVGVFLRDGAACSESWARYLKCYAKKNSRRP